MDKLSKNRIRLAPSTKFCKKCKCTLEIAVALSALEGVNSYCCRKCNPDDPYKIVDDDYPEDSKYHVGFKKVD